MLLCSVAWYFIWERVWRLGWVGMDRMGWEGFVFISRLGSLAG